MAGAKRPNTPGDLQATLRAVGCYDTADEKRRQALVEIEEILNIWASQLQDRLNPTLPAQETPGVSLVSFGSYRLFVHRRSADLDLLALSPPHCSRDDFFDSLVEILRKDERISNLHPIPTAYTPVIKFLLHDIKIDLLFVRLSNATKLLEYQNLQSSIGKSSSRVEYYIDDSDLIDLDDFGIRSINGARVSQRLLEIVPSVDDFRLVLRAVKGWAKFCGVQSNVLGFLGGINWAILVAWICVNHPQTDRSDPSKLLYLFFVTFAKWKWPEPVMLEPPQTEPPAGVTRMQFWDPEVNPRDGLHLMPIITPAYPSMNSSYSVGIPQLRRMQDEMYRAAYTLEKSKCHWSLIFRDCGFFQRHGNFVQIIMSAQNAEDLLLWSRLCETKLRVLISGLETDDVQAWPFANFFERPNSTSEHCHEMHFFVALRFAPGVEQVDLRDSTSDFLNKVNSWEDRRAGMDLRLFRITADNLPSFVFGEEAKSGKDALPSSSSQAPAEGGAVETGQAKRQKLS